MFALALGVPFPGAASRKVARRVGLVVSSVLPPAPKSWTVRVRERGVEALPPEKLLPDGPPTYVASWIWREHYRELS